MQKPLFLSRLLSALALALATPAATSASLAELFSSVPRPPADAAAALNWVDGGRVVQPDFIAVAQALAAERASLAGAGGEEVALSWQPVSAGDGDADVVHRAAQAFNDYLAANAGDRHPRHLLAKRKRWLQRALGQQQMEINERIKPCPAPCADAALIASNDRQLQLRARTLDTEIRTWNALFDDWKKTRAAYVLTADARISAIGDQLLATTAQGRAAVVQYRAAMLDEIAMLLSISELSALRAAAITRGLDGSEPDSISGATKRAAPGS